MKIYNYLIAIFLFAVLLISCDRDYKAPPLAEPKVDAELIANTTIVELKKKYNSITSPTPIEVDYVVKAYVIANDISGNIYKQIYIQDATGGINIGIDQNSIYSEYRVGQEIYIHLKGLNMIKYGEQLQIGYAKTNANRIPWEIFKYYTAKNGWAKVENVTSTVIDLGNLKEEQVNTLVTVKNVYFEEGGKASFSKKDATTNRILKDKNGNSIIVRTSNYAKFSTEKLPLGTGSLTGLLSKFRDTWQFVLREKSDIGQFDGVAPVDNGSDVAVDPKPGTGGSGNGASTTILKETFSSSLGSFSEYSIVGNYKWKWNSFKNKEGKVVSTYAKMTGYNGSTKTTEANEDWLISPKMDLSSVSKATLTFQQAINYATDIQNEQTLWISSNYNSGNPTEATWTQLVISNYPTGKDWKFVASGNIAIPAEFIGKNNVHIAFKYKCNATKSATWEIKDILVQ